MQDIFKTKAFKVLLKNNNGIDHNPKFAGVAVPVFSLKSNDSFGIGEFNDLKHLADWCQKTGIKIIQILPINDTRTNDSWSNSYPYKAISTKALHPIYLNLSQMGTLYNENDKEYFDKQREILNAKDFVDYPEVMKIKDEFFKKIFPQTWNEVKISYDYRIFFEKNKEWLVPYAEFCIKSQQTTDNRQHPELYYFLQYHLDKQLTETIDYLHQKGIALKGDIPIGIGRHSVEAWTSPHLFNLDSQAGAPPDSFAAEGQNWGFPTYNWDEMIKDGCQWWIRRFQNMARYFDAYRIDHVLGFFRIWEIPVHAVGGLLGQFQPSQAMSMEEINGYGLYLSEDFMTRPFIADWVLDRIFGNRAEEVKHRFLVYEHDDIWSLKSECDTERKVEAMNLDAELTNGLYALIRNVLFVRDHKNPLLYHPRIAVQNDTAYETLWQHDKDNFNRLYNDYFYRRNNQFWYEEAMKKLPLLVDATDMLVCAEDLGMVPDCVPWVLNQLQILSLELISMPKDSSVRFGVLDRNPWRSVCTISSHDSATMRMWWDEDESMIQGFYNDYLGYDGAAPHPMPGWLAQDMLQRHLNCPSALCILTLQDWLACNERMRLPEAGAERINIPANPRHYWRYRMHLNIEDLMEAIEFNTQITGMICQSGR